MRRRPTRSVSRWATKRSVAASAAVPRPVTHGARVNSPNSRHASHAPGELRALSGGLVRLRARRRVELPAHGSGDRNSRCRHTRGPATQRDDRTSSPSLSPLSSDSASSSCSSAPGPTGSRQAQSSTASLRPGFSRSGRNLPPPFATAFTTFSHGGCRRYSSARLAHRSRIFSPVNALAPSRFFRV